VKIGSTEILVPFLVTDMESMAKPILGYNAISQFIQEDFSCDLQYAFPRLSQR
jgi:hypothetical protein